MTVTILEDTREIKTIDSFDYDPEHTEGKIYYTVGYRGVTKIEAYGEPGMHCDLPFFAVYRGDELFVRLSAMAVEVTYVSSPLRG